MRQLFYGLLLLLFTACNAQTSSKQEEYKERIAELNNSIANYLHDKATGYYKEDITIGKPDTASNPSFLWPLCALLQAANEVAAAGLNDLSVDGVLQSIQQYASDAPPSFGYAASITSIKQDDRFYDDNQWIAISCLDAYERTNNKQYLDEAKRLYTFMMTGFDTISGGGIYWKEHDKTTKNTCSNGPGIIIALQLYKATNEQPYLDTALQLYNWTNSYLLSSEGVYYDNLKLPSLEVDKRTYTYNTGTMLQSNVLLYELTKEQRYVDEAKRIAAAAYNHFFKNNRWPGHAWFNAVLLRGYLALYEYDKEDKYIAAFVTDGDERWENERDKKTNLLGKKEKKELIEQAAMMEIYARLLLHQQAIAKEKK